MYVKREECLASGDSYWLRVCAVCASRPIYIYITVARSGCSL